MRRALAVYLDDRVPAPPVYSMILGEEDATRRGARALHLLYRQSRTIIRSRTPARLFRGLFAYLSAYLEDGGLLRVQALPLVADGTAFLAPRAVLHRIERLEGPLARLGMRVVDTPFATIDPATAELVVGPPALRIDEAALEGMEPAPPDPARYRIRGWGFGPGRDGPGAMSRSQGVAAAASTRLQPATLSGQRLLTLLAAVFEDATPVTIPADTNAFCRQVDALLRAR